MAKAPPWTPAEVEVLASYPAMTARDLAALLPGRTPQAVGNMRARHLGRKGEAIVVEPPVKPPGEYAETLSHYVVDDFECMPIWLKWNGYAAYRELDRDERGWVSILCTAK